MATNITSHVDAGQPPYAERAAAISDSIDAGILCVDLTGQISYRNEQARNWLPEGSQVDRVLADFRPIGLFESWADELHRVIETGSARHLAAAMIGGEQPSKALYTLRLSPLREGKRSEVSGVVILILQGQELDTLEHQLEVSARLASLGKLAARVAHELNNPLDGILRYTNLALRLVDESSPSKLSSYLSESRTGLMRMVQIIGDLLDYSRSTNGAFDSLSINEVVEQAIKSVSHAAESNNIVVAADFQTQNMPSVRGGRLLQVVCNLLKNAIDMMPGGGRLSITASLVDDNVVIQVSDTGPGLPDPPEKVFEPFFTTKEAGKGTGLGLAICKDFVEEMGGVIRAVNGKSGGAVFTIRIPKSACRVESRLSQTPTDNDLTLLHESNELTQRERDNDDK